MWVLSAKEITIPELESLQLDPAERYFVKPIKGYWGSAAFPLDRDTTRLSTPEVFHKLWQGRESKVFAFYLGYNGKDLDTSKYRPDFLNFRRLSSNILSDTAMNYQDSLAFSDRGSTYCGASTWPCSPGRHRPTRAGAGAWGAIAWGRCSRRS